MESSSALPVTHNALVVQALLTHSAATVGMSIIPSLVRTSVLLLVLLVLILMITASVEPVIHSAMAAVVLLLQTVQSAVRSPLHRLMESLSVSHPVHSGRSMTSVAAAVR